MCVRVCVCVCVVVEWGQICLPKIALINKSNYKAAPHTHTHTNIYAYTHAQTHTRTYILSSYPTVAEAPFSIATTGRYSFPWIAPLTLDPHLIMLSVKQGSIKYYSLKLWFDSTWD